MIELLHKSTEFVEHGVDALHSVAGGRAVRYYNAITQTAKLNKASNYRGMVISRKWNTVFRFTSEDSHFGKYLKNVGYLTGLAAGIVEAAPQIEAIMASSDSAKVKALQMTAIASTIAQRVLAGGIPAGVHLIYKSLEGYAMLASLAGGKVGAVANQTISTLERADALVQTTFKTVTDTREQSKAAWWVIDYVATPRKK